MQFQNNNMQQLGGYNYQQGGFGPQQGFGGNRGY